MLSHALVRFYMIWHGVLGLRGAGRMLNLGTRFLPGLRDYRIVLPEGQSLRIDFRDISSAYWLNYLCGKGFEEGALLDVVVRLLPHKITVWDIGANCGLFSYLAARSGLAERLLFFEPNPSVCKIAVQALRPFAFATGLNIALSDRNGEAVLAVPCGGSPGARLDQPEDPRLWPRQTVKLMTGDECLAQGLASAPAFIKIDTEGHEASVLAGLAATIAAHRPVIAIEHISLAAHQVAAITPPGYILRTIRNADATLCAGFSQNDGHNSLLIPAEHACARAESGSVAAPADHPSGRASKQTH